MFPQRRDDRRHLLRSLHAQVAANLVLQNAICIDGGGLTVGLAILDDFLEIVDRIEVDVTKVCDFPLDIPGYGNVDGKNRLALA